jgi:flagellar hook-basal body complex protein FliE
MVDSIKDVLSIDLEAVNKAQARGQNQGGSFVDILKESIDKVNALQGEADMAIEGLVKGETKNVHETIIAIEKANVSFNMMIQVRNKLLSAYEEIMRTQI